MSADLARLGELLDAETAPLVALLESLDDATWAAPTPAAGWSVADQASHLAAFHDAATASLQGDFSRYAALARDLGSRFCDEVAAENRARPPAELLGWLAASRAALRAQLETCEAGARFEWFGPSLSAAGMVSGRIMETWAHGQDVFDALGATHPVTPALVEVARLCARTRTNSYAVRGLVPPAVPVLVELTAPNGATWRFGDAGGEVIAGPAVEFCLVATQRRHVDDTTLTASGPAAGEWLAIAQAFAGPPGTGRSERR